MSKLSEMMDNLSPARDEDGHRITQKQWDELRQQLAEACGLLGGSSEWIRFGSTQERYLYAKIQKFILDNHRSN